MDAYQSSTLLAKLREKQHQRLPLRLACMDIDSTWTGSVSDQTAVRDLLESHGYVIAVVTNRTSEICISWEERGKSSPQAQSRPPAKFRFPNPQLYQTIDPREVPELSGLIDTDIIASTLGTELVLKQASGGYQVDNTYVKRLPASPENWHAKVGQLLRECANQGVEFSLHHPLDVAPTPLRIEAITKNRQQRDLLVEALTQVNTPTFLHITYDNLTVIVTPAQVSKEDAVNHLVQMVTQLTPVPPQNLHVFFAGDSVADQLMGFSSAPGTQATFLIPGGAYLADELGSKKFAGLKTQMTKTRNGATLPAGIYWFPKTSRYIVIGDEAFPGTVGPETLIAYLSQDQ